MDRVEYSWEDVGSYVQEVCEKYKNIGLCGVYGVPRGGIILAVLISHGLDVPMLFSPAAGCLIVDDICDTGETLVHYYKNSSAMEKPKYHITTMIYKENSLVKPEYYWDKKYDSWVVFPWEE